MAAKWPGEGLLRGGEGGGPSRHDVHRPTQRRRNCRTGHHSARFAELQLNSTLVNVPHIHVMCSPKDKQRCRRRAAMPQPCCQSLAGRVAPARPRERVCCVWVRSLCGKSRQEISLIFFSPDLRCVAARARRRTQVSFITPRSPTPLHLPLTQRITSRRRLEPCGCARAHAAQPGTTDVPPLRGRQREWGLHMPAEHNQCSRDYCGRNSPGILLRAGKR